MSAAKIMNLFSQFIETELEQEIDTDSSEWKALAKNVSKLLGKKDSKKKDPNAPKKPNGPWIQYCNEYREICKKEMEKKKESTTPKNVLKRLGKKWKDFQKINPEKMEEYKKKYEEDKEKYEEAKKKYDEENHDSDSGNSDSEPQKKKIKRGKNAWQMFCSEKRPELAGEFGPKEIMTKMSEMWKEIKEEGGDEYQKYVDMSNAEKERIKNEQEDEAEEEVEEEEEEEAMEEEVEQEEVEQEEVEQEEVEQEEVVEEEEVTKKQKKEKKEKKQKKQKKKKN